jgi:uncharacterized protein
MIAEAAWLLRDHPRGFQRILKSFHEGFLAILPADGSEAPAIAEIMKRYASLRPQFADAMLVYLASRENIETIFTLDRRDFLVYRSAHKSPFRLIPDLR